MARQSLSPMKGLVAIKAVSCGKVGRKKKDAPMTHLKYLRKRSGYTLESLADVTNISISYLSRLESGARRLNTDLIRRLSHAFSCDPAELLNETTHESRVITPLEFAHKRREILTKEHSMPLYTIKKDEEGNLEMTVCSPCEWCSRPYELAGHKDAFAVKAENYFTPHFNSSATLYLEPATTLAPESTVVLVNPEKVMVQKIWSVTPTSVQLCDVDAIDRLKGGDMSLDHLIEIRRDSIDKIYRIVGFSDFSLS